MERVKRFKWWWLALLIGVVTLVYTSGTHDDSVSGQKKWVVGIVSPKPAASAEIQGFIAGLGEHGYVDGKNTEFHVHSAKEGQEEALQQMVAQGVDLIFTISTPSARKAKSAIQATKIPGIFILYDPVEAGVVAGLTHPGGNQTGIQLRGSAAKLLELLLMVAPDIKQVYVPIKFDTKAAAFSLQALQEAADKLGVELLVRELERPEQFVEPPPADADAVVLLHSIMVVSNADKIVAQAIAHKLPTASVHHVKGAMIAYGADKYQVGRQASRLASMVLNGDSPADVPAEVADYVLTVNMATAKAVGVEFSDEFLKQADDIYY